MSGRGQQATDRVSYVSTAYPASPELSHGASGNTGTRRSARRSASQSR